jgi:translation initiation factor 2B subunit (eIF-2B alpha/beta/delta family)
MDINILIQQLQHVQPGETPSRVKLQAARVLEQLAQQLQHERVIAQNLQNQINQLLDEIELLRKAETSPEPSPAS